MNTNVENKFKAMGSKVIINENDGQPVGWRRERRPFGIDVNDKFIINKAKDVELHILDIDKKDKHLLL